MNIWIIGSGTFGLRAAQQLCKKDAGHKITLVDPSDGALDQADIPGLIKICEEGAAFLDAHLHPQTAPDWIVPALPVHLAWEWARMRLGRETLSRAVLPDSLVSSFPNAMIGDSGDVYVSHADFICPLNCDEPDQFCTRTGAPRKEDMFRLLERLGQEDLPAFIIRSRQLGPGLGGYRPRALFDLLARLDRHKGPCFVATACRCHGVVTGGARS